MYSYPGRNQMKKIDVIVKYFYPLAAGIEINVRNVYKHMVSHGWDVTIHTSTDMPEAKNSLPVIDHLDGMNIHRYPWRWYGFVPRIDWAHTPAIALHNFNIFPHSWLLIIVLIRRTLGMSSPKVFLTPHGGFTPEWRTFSPLSRFIKKTYQEILGVHLINAAVDGLRSVSDWEAVESIKHGMRPDIIHIIHNGLEREVYTQIEKLANQVTTDQVRKLGRYLIQIGRIHPIKNQATGIKALKHLPQDIQFVIIGPVTDPEYKKSLDLLISQLGLFDRVHFLGVISGVNKFYWLRHSVVNVHMALWESYCNVIHESMSQGCVCIVSRGTALEELIKDKINGFCVPEYDEVSVADAVKYILDSSHARQILAMRKRNTDFTRGHSWQNISLQVEKMYTTALGS